VKLRRATGRPARIEMMPIIDIVFLLLVFFIYAMLSMAVHHALPVQLPVSSAVQVESDEAVALTLQSSAAGLRIYIDDEIVTLDALTAKLNLLGAGVESRPIQVFGDKDVSYQQLFGVLDRIRAAGLSNISLVAEQQEGI